MKLPIAMVLLMLTGCVIQMEDIQRTAPIRTMTFSGSHRAVAQCIQDRLRGKVYGSEFGEGADLLVVFDSVKGFTHEGVSHYSLTITKTGPNQGKVEWRIVNQHYIPLADSAVEHFWIPVKECLERAR